ncbi:MAG: hypothetical protein GY844_29935 [Bradyrhizobium sp.]|nr:hypothetical protein [Bradyrhizobium sp.]
MSIEDLTAHEVNVCDLIAAEIAAAERRAPGYLAARLIAQADEQPLLVCGFPACVVGGREFLNGKAGGFVWADIRENVAAHMRQSFSEIASSGRFLIAPHRRHDVRLLKLTQAIWFLFRIRDQVASAVQSS